MIVNVLIITALLLGVIFIILTIYFAIKAYQKAKSGCFAKIIFENGVIGECETKDKKGSIKDGKIEGYWKVIRSDGETWEGNFHKGMMTGEGKIITPTFTKTSMFDHGIENGKSTIIFSNGSKAEGYVINGKLNGNRNITGNDGVIISKKMIDGISDGDSITTLTSGIKVITHYKKGIQVGETETVLENGESLDMRALKTTHNIGKGDCKREQSIEFKNITNNSVMVVFSKLHNEKIAYYGICYAKGDRISFDHAEAITEKIFSCGTNPKAKELSIVIPNLESNSKYSMFITAIDKNKVVLDISNEYKFKTHADIH